MSNDQSVINKTIGDVCRFILFSTQTRRPIYKKDITAIVKKSNVAKTQQVLVEVRKKLSEGFGFDLIEGSKKTTYFVVVQCDRNDILSEPEPEIQQRGRLLNYDEHLKKYRGLIAVVLQLLILNNYRLEKDTLHHQLFEKLDTSVFGAPNDIIKELKTQKWIEEEREASEERTYIKLGPRANIETFSEWQYIAASELVNGMRPAENDRCLQRIENERKQAQHHANEKAKPKPNAGNRNTSRNKRGKR
eukprot:CAMPEP_0202712380 /NCGR_PEP_ID=MMETSP1385-20130828/39546_1 /ASSEMBLY_ACC=CAM_ASM_000861 /TAXON_ID=933848 /ORGANISM="Elphidium margaritaceum" /LENGTH=246 /DNA_ID=CAMNT_0049372397 /DNA_START=34 /DNA_END=777 /DNA_ORIENTATION=-